MAKSKMSDKDKEKLFYWAILIVGVITFFYQLDNLVTFITSATIGVAGALATYIASKKLFFGTD